MKLGLEGRVALVTGAAGGIGTEICRHLGAEGCRLALVEHPDVIQASLTDELTQTGVDHGLFAVDVCDFDAADELVREVETRWDRVDLLVCCAGITRDAVSWKMSEEDFDHVLDVNLKGVFNFNRAIAPSFRARGWGRIVNVASINGLRGKFGQVNYAASKGGVIALSKTMARELGKFGVTVNCVAPGMVRTAMTKSIPQAIVDAAVAESVVGRLAEPSDIAQAVVFLCSEAARHITGEVLRVDGGQYI